VHESARQTVPRARVAYGSDTVLTGRTATEFAGCFGDFEIVPPGIAPIT
jgi:hypothetical protein